MFARNLKRPASLSIAALVTLLAISPKPPTAFAHGHTEVGDYELTIGFHVEPAYQGEPNGLDLFVERKPSATAAVSETTGATGAMAGMTETAGAAAPGAADATSGITATAGMTEAAGAATSAGEAEEHEHEAGTRVNGLADTLKAEIIFGASKKELTLEPQYGQDGAYTAHLVPSEAGDYTWHIYGSIEGTPVDVSMTSGPDTFGAVEAKDSVAFPNAEPQAAAAEAQIAALGAEVGTARMLGTLGAVLGMLGLLAGVMGWRAGGRRR